MSARQGYGRQSTTTPSQPSSRLIPNPSQLPEYEAPDFPLNQKAIRLLQNVWPRQKVSESDRNLVNAQRLLAEDAADANERLLRREERLDKIRRHLENQENVSPGDEEDLHQKTEVLNQLRKDVEKYTELLDAGIRKMIDSQHAMQWAHASLNEITRDPVAQSATRASTQMPSQSQARLGEDDDEVMEGQDFMPTDPTGANEPPLSAIESFRSKLELSTEQYQAKTQGERYASNVEYGNFKKIVHEAKHLEDGVPVPEPHTWFNDGPPPGPGVTGVTRAGTSDGDDDDDIEVQRATISTKCPVTLREFQKPLTSRKCHHSYEAEAIRSLFGSATFARGRPKSVRCPVTSCESMVTETDLYEDTVLAQRIQRLQRLKRLREAEVDNEDMDMDTQNSIAFLDDEQSEEMVEEAGQTSQRTRAKPEPTPSIE